MEVKPGYKQTEVGVIPEDWEMSTVSQFGDVKRGAGSQYIKYVRNNGVRLIRINDFFEQNPVFISPTDEILKYAINENDVLFAGTGSSAGASYIPKEDWIGLPHSYNVPRIRVKKNRSKQYLLFSLQSDYVANQQRAWFVGAAQPFLDTHAISNFKIAIPKQINEQRAIATALSDADAHISSLEQLIAKKRDLKQAAMQDLLTGKRRLPGFGGKWNEEQIGSFAKCISGGTPNTLIPSYWGGSIRWMCSGELNLKYVTEVSGRITEEGLKNSSARLIPKKSVLIGLVGQGKTRGTVATNLVELCTNQSMAAILPNSTFYPDYLYHNLDFRYDEIRNLSTGGGGRDVLNLPLIRSISISLPQIDEQRAIATVLSDMDAEITALEQQRDKTKVIKQGMMQELLTGRIRLM